MPATVKLFLKNLIWMTVLLGSGVLVGWLIWSPQSPAQPKCGDCVDHVEAMERRRYCYTLSSGIMVGVDPELGLCPNEEILEQTLAYWRLRLEAQEVPLNDVVLGFTPHPLSGCGSTRVARGCAWQAYDKYLALVTTTNSALETVVHELGHILFAKRGLDSSLVHKKKVEKCVEDVLRTKPCLPRKYTISP